MSMIRFYSSFCTLIADFWFCKNLVHMQYSHTMNDRGGKMDPVISFTYLMVTIIFTT